MTHSSRFYLLTTRLGSRRARARSPTLLGVTYYAPWKPTSTSTISHAGNARAAGAPCHFSPLRRVRRLRHQITKRCSKTTPTMAPLSAT
eukprot:scaffold15790_cov41-Phaeocystis_antarctica.AAC.1